MDKLNTLLLRSKIWYDKTQKKHPDFFSKKLKKQSPYFLWICCCDSRVPPDVILETAPGSLFVHRNIANLVTPDVSTLSVVEYAVNVLKVQYIILCGHYLCGGVQAVVDNTATGALQAWLAPVQRIFEHRKIDLQGLSRKEQGKKLCEWNVAQQVQNLQKIDCIQSAQQTYGFPVVQGLMYDFLQGKFSYVEKE